MDVARAPVMRKLLLLCLLATGAAATGCAADKYYYQPAEQATAISGGHPAAQYSIPPGRQGGDVRVTSFGVTKLEVAGREERIKTLHVRLDIANENGREPWSLDTRSVGVQFEGSASAVAPTYAHTGDAGLPLVQIPPGASRTVDLYYPLPAEIKGERQIPRFDVVWRVQTDDEVVAERTPFERREIEPATPTVYYGFGVGAYPHGWYDPWYPRGVIIERTRRPRVYYYGYPR
jgi:hypothetical protein